MSLTLLSALKPGTKDISVLAKVIRKWDFISTADDQTIFHVSIILADDKGNIMYAEIPKDEVKNKRDMVNVEKTYIFSRFIVRTAKTTYMPFSAHYMIEFTSYSRAKLVKDPPDTFPAYVYDITPFNQLDNKLTGNVNFVDVIGFLLKVDTPQHKSIKGHLKPRIIREILIEDTEGATLKVTLWGQRALEFDTTSVYDPQKHTPIVILFVGCLPKSIEKITQLSGNNACHWYFNPQIPEAEEFYAKSVNRKIEIQQTDPAQIEPADPTHYAVTEERSLSELNAMDPYDFPEQGYNTTVTITKVPQGDDWWYPACTKCRKRMQDEGGKYYCFACKRDSVNFSYKLNFFAADDREEAKFFCYDTIARQIIQRNCIALLNPLKRTSAVPPELAAIVSKKFTFAVSLTEDSFRSATSRTYLVNTIVARFDRQPVLPQISKSPNVHQPFVTENQQQFLPPPARSHIDKSITSPSAQKTTPMTPPPPSDVDETPTKDLPNLNKQTESKHLAPKKLFTDTEGSKKDEEPQDIELSQFKSKRQKTTHQKRSGKTTQEEAAASDEAS